MIAVRIEWSTLNSLTGKFEPDTDGVEIVEARETKRMIYIPFPSGWIKGVRKFTRDTPRSAHVEYFGNGHRRKWRATWPAKISELEANTEKVG